MSHFNENLYQKIIFSLSSEEKKLTSEWIKEVNINDENYNLQKIKNFNYIIVDGKNLYDYLYLGTTIFTDTGKQFIPISSLDVKKYISNNKSKDFRLGMKILNQKDIYDICYIGKSEIINVIYSPFLIDLNEETFKTKNLKGELDNLNIQDLSLFYLEYFPSLANYNQDFKYINSEYRQLFFENIKKKIKLAGNLPVEPIELYGPFGIGKSCSLLAFQKAGLLKKSAYFNFNVLFNLKDIDKVKKMILYESMSLFDNFLMFSKLKDNINNKNFESPWDIIQEVINFILNNLNQIFYIILDQFKEVYKNLILNSTKKLETICHNSDFGLSIILCSSMNDADVKTNFLKAIKNNSNYIYIDKLFEIQTMDEREKLYFGTVSLFHILYINSKKELNDYIKDEKDIIKTDVRKSIPESSNLLKVISYISNIMKTDYFFSEEDIKNNLGTIPLKYILLKKKKLEDDKIVYTLDYSCLLIRIVFEELAVEELKKLKDTKYINELRGTYGEIFEIICHFALLSNKLENFNLKSENLFYLKKNIYNKEEIEKNWKWNEIDAKKMENLDSFYIRPTNTNSELYDSLVIFKENNNYSAYLFQISISKAHGKKIVSRENHYKAIDKVKKKINAIYGINLKNVYFSYIFNFDEIKTDDIIECSRLQVDYFYFSMENNKFYQSNIEDKINFENKNFITSIANKNFIFPINKLEFNLLSNMNYKKVITKFFKSKNEIENDKSKILQILNKKTKVEYISNILNDLTPVKTITKRNCELKLEIYCNSGQLKNVFYYLKNKEYVCLIKLENKNIYIIFDNVSFIFNNNKFDIINDRLGTLLFINEINVEYEIFSIIENN